MAKSLLLLFVPWFNFRKIIRNEGRRIMNRMLKRHVKHYCRSIAKQLPYSGKKKQSFLNVFQKDIDNFILEKDISTMTEIYGHFGQVEDILESHFTETPYQDIKKKVKISRKIWVSVLSILAILVIGTLLFNYYLFTITPDEIVITTTIYETEEK
ncbi:DUF6120 family protein [Lachnospiraceae bacterium ZAX-1]